MSCAKIKDLGVVDRCESIFTTILLSNETGLITLTYKNLGITQNKSIAVVKNKKVQFKNTMFPDSGIIEFSLVGKSGLINYNGCTVFRIEMI